MSLARAFTTRRNRTDKPTTGMLGRTASQRSPTKINRAQISAPINLISSTNVLSFDAPDIVGSNPVPLFNSGVSSAASDTSSRSSADHSDVSSNAYSMGTMTDASSFSGSEPNSPEPNHLSCYFKPSVYPSRSNSMRSVGNTSPDAPAIPQRAPSHSKKAHMHVSRQNSISRLRSPPSSAQEMTKDFFSESTREQSHPFGKELEQLNEVAEEFGGVVRDVEAEADHAFMEAHGLGYFCATDYMLEIHSMLNTVFEEEQPQTVWI